MIASASFPVDDGRSRRPDPTKGRQSPARQQFVLLLQRIGFGTIQDLSIRAGNPVLDPLPRVRTRRKNGGSTPSRPSAATSDFALKREWVDFFRDLDAIGNGTVVLVEVAHGLPIIHEFEGVLPV